VANARESARQSRCAQTPPDRHGLHQYLGHYGECFPCAQDPVSASPNYFLWMGRGFRGFIRAVSGRNLSCGEPVHSPLPERHGRSQTVSGHQLRVFALLYHSPDQVDAMTKPSDSYFNPAPSVAQYSAA